MLSVVIDDGAFATGLGVFLTFSITLMAYMVKTMFNINSIVALLAQRVDGLEKREAHRWQGDLGRVRVRLIAAIAAFGVMLVLMWGGLFLWTQSNEQRRHDACVTTQSIYDGQFTYTRFLARQLHATKDRTDQAIRELRHEVGPRPECG